jgi:uncharacterized protein (DUF433 family)
LNGANILPIEEIVSDPNIRRGRAVIKGTGLEVTDVMYTHTTGDYLSPQEIVKNYGITLGQVHAALAYYYLHQEEIDEQLRRREEETMRLIDELERQGKLSRLEVSLDDAIDEWE